MQKCLLLIVCLVAFVAPAAFASVSVSSPSNGGTVQSPVHFVATATTSCSKGVASVGIYTAPGVLAFTGNGSKLDTQLSLNTGTYNAVVQEWDYCGRSTTTPVTITVQNQTGVQVTSPANNSTVGSPVHYVATASSPSCAKGVASMGIYTAAGVLAYTVNGANLDTNLTLNPGTYNTVVQEWDYCGGSASTPVTVTVKSASQVQVTSPANNATVGSPVNFAATATSSCAKGVASMGIYTAPNKLAYQVNGAKLNTSLSLSPGNYTAVVEEWDNCGGAATTPVSITVTSSSGVQVSSPSNGSTVSSPVTFKASASSSCSAGVASMGIYTAPGQLAYVGNGASLNTSLTLNSGTYSAVVQEWDNCGGSSATPVTFTVSGGSNVFSSIQAGGGWNGYILLAPSYNICDTCSPNGPEETWWTKQGISSPSLSGKAMEFNIGGSTAYSDVLWNVHLVGDGAPNLDQNHQIVPNIHNFIYDVYFFGADLSPSQALEFDINQFTNGLSFIWGTECRIMGGNQWAIWDNQKYAWTPTGIPCYPKSNDWNHLTIQVQRTSDNRLLYQTITLNGQQYTLNAYYPPTQTSWYGVTVNYQMDGNYKQQSYSTYLDNFSLTYW